MMFVKRIHVLIMALVCLLICLLSAVYVQLALQEAHVSLETNVCLILAKTTPAARQPLISSFAIVKLVFQAKIAKQITILSVYCQAV